MRINAFGVWRALLLSIFRVIASHGKKDISIDKRICDVSHRLAHFLLVGPLEMFKRILNSSDGGLVYTPTLINGKRNRSYQSHNAGSVAGRISSFAAYVGRACHLAKCLTPVSGFPGY